MDEPCPIGVAFARHGAHRFGEYGVYRITEDTVTVRYQGYREGTLMVGLPSAGPQAWWQQPFLTRDRATFAEIWLAGPVPDSEECLLAGAVMWRWRTRLTDRTTLFDWLNHAVVWPRGATALEYRHQERPGWWLESGMVPDGPEWADPRPLVDACDGSLEHARRLAAAFITRFRENGGGSRG
jgi:hypothetical protein